jgi:hypothetical protein
MGRGLEFMMSFAGLKVMPALLILDGTAWLEFIFVI